MKSQQLDDLISGLAACQAIEKENARIWQQNREARTELATLETTCDFSNPDHLTRLAQLHAVKNCAEVRITAGNERLAEACEELENLIEFFVKDAFVPRYHDLQARAQVKVRAACKSKFQDVEAAISGSPVMLELRELEIFKMRGAVMAGGEQKRAGQLIEAWAKADAFEKANLG